MPTPEAITFRNIPQSERAKMDKADFAGQGQSFPIKTPADVKAAVQSLGRTNQDKAKVKARIIAICYRKGPEFVAALPDDWKRASDKKASMSSANETPAPATFSLDTEGRYEQDGYAHYPNATLLKAGTHQSGEGIEVSWDSEDLWAIAGNFEPVRGDLEHVFARNPSVMQGNLSALRDEMGELQEVWVDPEDEEILRGHVTVPLWLDRKLQGKGISVEVLPDDLNRMAGYTLTTDPVIPQAALMSTLLEFAGSRHSKGDAADIQKIHDIASQQGAACKTPDTASRTQMSHDTPKQPEKPKEKKSMSALDDLRAFFSRKDVQDELGIMPDAAPDTNDDHTVTPPPSPVTPTRAAEPDPQVAALLSKVAQLEADKREAQAGALTDGLIRDGKVTPCNRESVKALFSAALEDDEREARVITFSNGQKLSRTDALRATFDAQPAVVELGEVKDAQLLFSTAYQKPEVSDADKEKRLAELRAMTPLGQQAAALHTGNGHKE